MTGGSADEEGVRVWVRAVGVRKARIRGRSLVVGVLQPEEGAGSGTESRKNLPGDWEGHDNEGEINGNSDGSSSNV